MFFHCKCGAVSEFKPTTDPVTKEKVHICTGCNSEVRYPYIGHKAIEITKEENKYAS